jgi:hypothetical protein
MRDSKHVWYLEVGRQNIGPFKSAGDAAKFGDEISLYEFPYKVCRLIPPEDWIATSR